MYVGGEFYYDSRWSLEKPVLSTLGLAFLNGGKACLVVIADALRDLGINSILLPSYICPSVVNTLEDSQLRCDYYQIKPDFSIDLEDLNQKAPGYRAVYFINYFGFAHPPTVRDALVNLKERGIFLVEDNAQAGFLEPTTGDFIFNSMRKLVPYDGGYLQARQDVNSFIERYRGLPNRRLPVIRAYREQLADYHYLGRGDHTSLVSLYNLAECYYDSDLVVEGDPQERQKIETLDWDRIKQVRRKNYAYLLSLIKDIPRLSPVFPSLQENNMPLGLPVYVSGISRDWLVGQLGDAGIGLLVHWEEILHDPRLNRNCTAVEMAGKILTLAVDQRTSHKQMDYMVQKLMELLQL